GFRMDRGVPWRRTSAPRRRLQPAPPVWRPRVGGRRPASAAQGEAWSRMRPTSEPSRPTSAPPGVLAYAWSSLWLRRRRRAHGTVHVRRQDQLGADRIARPVETAQLDLRDIDDARQLGDPLEELTELVVARLGVHRDRDLAVVVPHYRRAGLEERDGQPGRGRGVGQ